MNNFIKTIIIGRYGGNVAISAVGLSNSLTGTFITIFITGGFCIGIVSLVSRQVGARQYKVAAKLSIIGFLLGLISCLIISIVMFAIGKEILYILGARNEILSIGYSFIRVNAIAMFFYMIMALLNSILIGYGNTFVPFICSLIVVSFKIILNYLLVYGIGFEARGINGVALASISAYSVGFMFSLYYIVCIVKVRFKLFYITINSLRDMKKMLALAIPCSLEEAAFNISKLICVSIIIRSGSVSFAADEIANMIEAISVMPSIGFGIAVITLVGHNIGKKDYVEAKKTAYTCVFYAVVIMSIFGVMFLFMPRLLVDFFMDENEKKVAFLAGKCLAIGAVEQPFIAASLVLAGALRGVGDVKSPFLISCFTSWIIRLPLIYYFISILNYKVTAVWWITALQWGVDALLMFIIFEYRFYKLSKNHNKA